MKFIILLIVSCVGTLKVVQAADDCPPGSLDNLQLSDLMKKSNEGQKCLNEAREVFEKKYNRSNFIFENRLVNIEHPVFQESGSTSYLRNVNVIKRIVINFGDLIRELSVSFDRFSVEEGKDILKHIDQHCFASLKTFSLRDCNGNVLDELKNTYENVKSLYLSVYHSNEVDIRSDDEKLNKFFPNIESLRIDSTKPSNWKFITGKFAKLNSVNMKLQQEEQNIVDESHVAQLIKDNPQIETLNVGHINFKLLKQISQDLKKLKRLDLTELSKNYLNYEGETINLNSVHDLHVALYKDGEILQNVTFNGLNELRLYIKTKSGNNWNEFINQVNPNIKTFSLDFYGLKAADLLVIAEKFPRLDKLYLTSQTKFVATDIVKLMEKVNKKIIYLSIETRMDELEQNKLKDLIPDKWSIEFRSYSSAVEVTIKIEPKKASTGYNGGSSPLVMSHLTQVLAITLVFAFVKSF